MGKINLVHLRLGDLLVDSTTDAIIQVKSLEATGITLDAIPIYNKIASVILYEGLINGRPSCEFDECPITQTILKDLKWREVPDIEKGIVTFYPPLNSTMLPGEEGRFQVIFVLKDNAVKRFEKGSILTRSNDSKDCTEIDYMSMLSTYYYECFKSPMVMKIPEFRTIPDGYQF